MIDRPRYAGIGSRNVRPGVSGRCVLVARKMREDGYVLRTGGAVGCDQAFARGAAGLYELYLPWADYERDTFPEPDLHTDEPVILSSPSLAAMRMAADHHPTPHRLTRAALRLHARNCHILLGPRLDSPVERVICWTEDERRGGTAFGISMARKLDIPVENLAASSTLF